MRRGAIRLCPFCARTEVLTGTNGIWELVGEGKGSSLPVSRCRRRHQTVALAPENMETLTAEITPDGRQHVNYVRVQDTRVTIKDQSADSRSRKVYKIG